jgi:hypothetical protein
MQQGMDEAFFDDLSIGDVEGIETDFLTGSIILHCVNE